MTVSAVSQPITSGVGLRRLHLPPPDDNRLRICRKSPFLRYSFAIERKLSCCSPCFGTENANNHLYVWHRLVKQKVAYGNTNQLMCVVNNCGWLASFAMQSHHFLASSLDNQSRPSYKPWPWVAQVAWMYHCGKKKAELNRLTTKIGCRNLRVYF